MQYPVIDLITQAYLNNGWTGLDIPQTIIYEPIQLGSGDPSPDNIRPILPATTLNINGIDISVYGGTLDVTTGELLVDRSSVDLGEVTWYLIVNQNTGIQYFYTYISTLKPNAEVVNTLLTNYAGMLPAPADKHYSVGWGYIGPTSLIVRDDSFSDSISFKESMTGQTFVYPLATTITYQLSPAELVNAIGIENDIAHRLKLPLPHYFPHPVIDALQRAAAGTQTADDTEILRHYLTPLGIGGI